MIRDPASLTRHVLTVSLNAFPAINSTAFAAATVPAEGAAERWLSIIHRVRTRLH
jgi:hypothetical protein